ncbi:MAG: V-type ATP synthase subunit F [Candidatus Borkfalkiaceae bacterium]|nr:V-type ATP synthase subunit F [Christensenellaceae bacterium]
MTGKTAIIGNGESILAFKAGGVDAYPCESTAEARETLRRIARDYGVIFLTDDLAAEMDDLLKRMAEEPYPAVVPIPSEKGSSGYAQKKMKEEMERALGVDILFQREER